MQEPSPTVTTTTTRKARQTEGRNIKGDRRRAEDPGSKRGRTFWLERTSTQDDQEEEKMGRRGGGMLNEMGDDDGDGFTRRVLSSLDEG